MMRLPGFGVDDGLVIPPVAFPVLPDVDLAAVEARVRGWGGRTDVFRHHVAAAVQADASAARGAAVLAAWRAGVVRLRDEARASIPSVPPRVAELALGLESGTLAAFRREQEYSRYGHPADPPVIARLGGFRGIGGLLLAPPADAHPTLHGVAIRSGDEWWHLVVDIFGAKATRVLDARDVPANTRSDVGTTIAPDSYLVTLRRAP